MLCVVPIGVIGMHGVGVVGGNQHGTLHQQRQLRGIIQQALNEVAQHRPLRARGRQRSHFFVIVAHQQAPLLAVRGEQRAQSGVAREQIVEARRGDKILVQAEDRRRLAVVKTQLVIQHLVEGDAVLAQTIGQTGAQRPLFARVQTENRRHLRLRIHRAVAVGLAIQMYGQTRYHRDGIATIQQGRGHLPRGGHMADAPGQREVAIEPGIQQRPAVHLDAELQTAFAAHFGLRFDHQTGAVGMRAHHAQAALLKGTRSGPQRNKAAALSIDHTAIAGGDPGAGLAHLETGLAELRGHGAHRVKRRDRLGQKTQQAAIEAGSIHHADCAASRAARRRAYRLLVSQRDPPMAWTSA